MIQNGHNNEAPPIYSAKRIHGFNIILLAPENSDENGYCEYK